MRSINPNLFCLKKFYRTAINFYIILVLLAFLVVLISKNKKRASHFCEALYLIWRLPTFPLGVAVSSATQGLTSLFEMVKGVHLLYNHQKYL